MINISISINELYSIIDIIESYSIHHEKILDLKIFEKLNEIDKGANDLIYRHYGMYKNVKIAIDLDKKIHNIGIDNNDFNLIQKVIKGGNSIEPCKN